MAINFGTCETGCGTPATTLVAGYRICTDCDTLTAAMAAADAPRVAANDAAEAEQAAYERANGLTGGPIPGWVTLR